jgi:uncharacterized protein
VPPITFHLVPRAAWEACDPAVPYTPADFEREGFVHCTDGEDEVTATANRYFSELSDELLVLTIDRTRLSAPVRYEGGYPHVYGSIERQAIIQVRNMRRRDDGTFEPIR